MELISLTMENFMPYKGKTFVQFPQDEVRNVMVIYGENMRGKTSFLNALRWAFYEKAEGRHLKEIPLHEILNKEAALEGDFVVEVGVEFFADGHRYSLRRRATKKSLVAMPTRSEDFDIEVGLQRDGVAIKGHLIEAEINKFAPEQVSRFFLFDGELLQEYETLLIEGSEQGKRIKEAIEKVLGVPTLINGRDEMAALLRNFTKQQAKELAHVEGLERRAEKQSEWQSKQEAYEKDLEDLRARLSSMKQERIALDDELEKVDSVRQAKVKLDFNRDQQKEILEEQKNISDKKRSLLRDAWKDLLASKLSLIKTNLEDKERLIAQKLEHKGRLQAKLENLRQILDRKACPTCGHEPNDSTRNKVGSELGEVEALLRLISEEQLHMTDMGGEIREIDRLLKSDNLSKIRDLDRRNAQIDVQLTKIENEIEELDEQIRGYDTAEIARKRALRDSLLKQEGGLEKDIDDRIIKIDEAKRELAVIARDLQSLPQAKFRKSTAIVNLCQEIERAFSQSIERLRDDLRRHVQRRASEAFRQLTTQKSYSGLEINNNYGLTILDERSEKVTVRSAGAEQIVALSLIDGLARTGRAAGPVVMDTPFGRLDLKHRDNILRYLPNSTRQLILLVHDGEIRRDTDLEPVASRVGAEFEIREISPRHSRIERVTQ
jgi:DNA sulfur modification protein DndD